MFVKSQDGAVVLNNDRVTEYSTDSKYDGRYKVAALVGENRVVIGRYSTKEKCRMAISMLMDCYTMNLLFERGQDENPRDLVCEYVADGYFPCKETKMKIINALRDLTDEQVELSESLYDGMQSGYPQRFCFLIHS